MPSSVATMNDVRGDVTTCLRRPDVDATTAAWRRMASSHSGCAITSAPGWRVMRSMSFFSENVSCTTHVPGHTTNSVSYTHLRAHETRHDLVCRLLLEKKK